MYYSQKWELITHQNKSKLKVGFLILHYPLGERATVSEPNNFKLGEDGNAFSYTITKQDKWRGAIILDSYSSILLGLNWSLTSLGILKGVDDIADEGNWWYQSVDTEHPAARIS